MGCLLPVWKISNILPFLNVNKLITIHFQRNNHSFLDLKLGKCIQDERDVLFQCVCLCGNINLQMLLHCGRVNSLLKLLKWSQPYRMRYVEYINLLLLYFTFTAMFVVQQRPLYNFWRFVYHIDLLCTIKSNVLV